MRHNGGVSAPADLTYRVGGNVGRRARRSGFWFNPVIWSLLAATATWGWLRAACTTASGFSSGSNGSRLILAR